MRRDNLILSLICALTALFLLFPLPASAESAPERSVELHVVNAPEGAYLIDLLIDTQRAEALPDALDPDDKAEKKLRAYKHDGWQTRCAGLDGAGYALIRNTEDHVYLFTNEIPEHFRVVIITEDGKTMVSTKLRPILQNTTVTFDAVSGSLTESAADAGSSILNDVKKMWPNFGLTLAGTLVIEGIIMAVFLLEWGWKGWIKFLFAQILTHILLYLFLEICVLFGVLFTLKIPIAAAGMFVIELGIYDKFVETPHRARMWLAVLLANAATGALMYFVPTFYGFPVADLLPH
ncbi:MAG: hypothetical protein IKQ91_05765 [Oscillospiraceae bacterium]|nr:hypothetical protein [Oscillospiraceae bacterium]